MRSVPLPTHDPTLGPIAAAHTHSPPRPAALALLTTGLANGITPSVVIAWTKSRLPHRADLVELLTGPARPRLVAAARKHIRETSTPDGRHRLAIRHARRLVGSVFSSAAGGGGRVVGARASVAMLGKIVLLNLQPEGNGITAPRIDAGRLGVALGAEPQAVGTWLKTATEESWMRTVRGGPGHTPTRTLQQLRGERVHTADDHTALIDRLAVLDRTDPTVAAIASVDHPAWGYSLGRRAWLVLTADVAGIDVVPLGVPDRSAGADRKTLGRLGIAAGPDLNDALDRIARTVDREDGTAPLDRAEAKERARQERAAKRRADVERARATRAEERAKVKADQAPRTTEPATVSTVPLPQGYRHDDQQHRAELGRQIAAQGMQVVAIDPDQRTVMVQEIRPAA